MIKKWFGLWLGILFIGSWFTECVAGKTYTLAMTQPTAKQVRNIEELYEKNILPLADVKLIGIFHEDEETDYSEAREYVKQRNLRWVSFRAVTGQVAARDIFRENSWTGQFREIFRESDGIIFTGGEDIPPSLFGQEQSLLTVANTPQRSLYEVSFLFHLAGGSQNSSVVPFLEEKKGYVILAICLGMQSLNVAAGGTLAQDIPSEVYGLKTVEAVLKMDPDQIHCGRYLDALHPACRDLAPQVHRIQFVAGTPFPDFLTRSGGKKAWQPRVISAHHQALGRLGQDILVSARSLDGKIIEMVYHRRYPHILGVQFHPEHYKIYSKGLRFRQKPGQAASLSLRSLFLADGVSLRFNELVWQWLADSLQKQI